MISIHLRRLRIYSRTSLAGKIHSQISSMMKMTFSLSEDLVEIEDNKRKVEVRSSKMIHLLISGMMMALAPLEEGSQVALETLATLAEVEEIHLLDLGKCRHLMDLMILEVVMADFNHFPAAFQAEDQAHKALKLKLTCRTVRR